MTRYLVPILLSCTLLLGGCKKNATPTAKPEPAKPPAVAAGPTAPAAAPAEPKEPDFTPSVATPKPTPRPQIDPNASAMVLCYHNIEDGKSNALTITTSQFEQEMKALKDGGFAVVGMQDFLAWRRGEKSIPAKSCVITIDDGWVSGYTNAWPILKKYGYPFTMFVYVNYVGTGGKSVSWQQLEEMRDAGVDIQSHTYSHANLKNPTLAGSLDAKNMSAVKKDLASLGQAGWMRKEIAESKRKIEEQLGIRVNVIAYPFGVYNAQAMQMAKESGYEAAFTVYGQRLTRASAAYTLGRYAVDAKQPKIFKDALAMIGGGGGTIDTSANTIGQLAAASMVTQPLNNETITNTQPTIKANLSTMGEIDGATVEVRLSGVGLLKPQYNAETKMLTAPVTQKLTPGAYTVIVAAQAEGQRKEVRWGFTVGQTAGSLLSATPMPAPAPAEPAPAKATPTPKKKK